MEASGEGVFPESFPIAEDFEEDWFAEGRFRLAYKATYTGEDLSDKGMPCVVKKEKSVKFWGNENPMLTLDIYDHAESLAEKFNEEGYSPKKLEFVGIHLSLKDTVTMLHVEDPFDYTTKSNLFNYIIEDYLPGDFRKWCSNYGFISTDTKTLPAFMHWSWVKTKGEMMVADLQGTRADLNGNETPNKYLLTDPVIMSNTPGGKYGCTDTGVEGIAMFFMEHRCSGMCTKFPKPSRDRIQIVLTAEEKRHMQKVQMSTALHRELVISRIHMEKLVTLFKKIANDAFLLL